MPTPGLSLVGFMGRDQALIHLRQQCVPSRDDDTFLEAEWQTAKAKLGPAIARAGVPNMQPIPASHSNYESVLKSGVYKDVFQQPFLSNTSIQLVEIDPLLSFQFAIDSSRTNHHCGHLSSPPTLDEMLAACLPITPEVENIQMQQLPQSIIVKSRNLNLQAQAQGFLNGGFLGVQFGMSLPFTHVVRFNGRSYLHNGFHRTYGLRLAGATHVPCIVRDVVDAPAAGIRADGGTFDIALLESANPPALAHYTQGRAHAVSLRATSRVLHVSWADYVLNEE